MPAPEQGIELHFKVHPRGVWCLTCDQEMRPLPPLTHYDAHPFECDGCHHNYIVPGILAWKVCRDALEGSDAADRGEG